MLGNVLKQLFAGSRAGRREPAGAQGAPAATDLIRQGLAHQEGGRYAQAESAYRVLVERDPRNADGWHLLGHACLQQGKLAEAAAMFERAAALAPQAEIYFNLGHAHAAQGALRQAVAAYGEALRLRPDFAAALNNLANAHKALGESDAAQACYERLIAAQPELAQAQADFGILLLQQGRLDEAIARFRRALELAPDFVSAHSYLVYALNFHPGYTPAQVFEEHRHWGGRHAEPLRDALPPPAPDRSPGRRLRVGYVSPNFYDHPVTYFFEPVLRHHDTRQFEVICYADVAAPDRYTRRLQDYPVVWKNTLGLTDEALARRVRADAVDILVDLTGHTEGHRLLAFARKPAPIQVTWNGYANTTGMTAMDYRITDAYADPPGMTEQWHTERLVRLPEIYMSYQPPEPSPAVTPPPCLAEGCVTLGSFNAVHKVTPRVIAVWAEILQAVPRARLMMLTVPEGRARRDLEQAFAGHGIDASRLEFMPRRPMQEFLALHARADIALDPFPFNGTTTTCQTLWMGVPLVALAGESHVSRVGVSMLSNLGLQELIARDERHYVEIAVALTRDPGRLAALRAGMRERMLAAPNTDGERLTRCLEEAYARMWKDYCLRADL